MASWSLLAKSLSAGGEGLGSPASKTHLVLIPSFNSGRLLAKTISAARSQWAPVWVVIDGSTDGSARPVADMAAVDPNIVVFVLPRNHGKGAAVRLGLEVARTHGFTHALIMDADGQHPVACIPKFMAASCANRQALVAGQPQFASDAPLIRVVWRRLSNAMAILMTGGRVGDTLFGFRIYPIEALLEVMNDSRGMRSFDFDPEALIRLVWKRTPLIKMPAPVRYLSRSEDGVSHFRYVRDNILLARMYLRLGTMVVRRSMADLRSTLCRS